jgi:zinc finger protein
VNVYSKDCLDRFIVKSEFATITIPEIELEIPRETQKGSIKTLEGYLNATAEGLKLNQEERRLTDPETAMKIDEFIEKLERMREGKEMPYHFIIDDPSGNSFVQNPHAPARDVYVSIKHYERTKKDLAMMGYAWDDTVDEEAEKEERKEVNEEHKEVKNPDFSSEEVEHMIKLAKKRETVEDDHKEFTSANFDYTKSIDEQSNDIGNINNEPFVIPLPCYQCQKQGFQKSCVSHIPHFKEIIIMAFYWEEWGFRSVEVKEGGGLSEKGRKITLKVENERDMTRDLFKGDNCSVEIPELELTLAPGTLGGIYTTVEGLISKIHDKLEEVNPFTAGDSSLDEKFRFFLKQLNELKEGNTPFTLILDDPLSNAYIYSPNYPDLDQQITVEDYERDFEQNEMLGINDMKVD